AVTLILTTIDRLKEVLNGLEQTEAEPAGDDKDMIGELERRAMAGAVARRGEPKQATGSLVAQTLERPLRSGEVSLDELERAFRETEMEMPAIVEKPKAEAAKAEAPKAEKPKPAKAERKSFAEDDEKQDSKIANQSIRVNVDTL